MKRILFSLLVVFSFSALHAQEWRDENRYHDPFDIYCGPTIGVAASNMTEYDGKYKFGPQIGAFIQTYFCNHFGMSFELNYSREGTRDAWQSFQLDRALGPYDYSMDYINTIYKMRYYPMHRLNVFLGFKFGVHINATCTLDGKDTDIKGALRRRAGHIVGGFEYRGLLLLPHKSFKEQRVGGRLACAARCQGECVHAYGRLSHQDLLIAHIN